MKYIAGAILSNVYRLAKVFPNSDPIMGFIIPAAKNEPAWKAPLFAFATMFSFDLITGRFGVWTWVTSATYALIALSFCAYLRSRKASLWNYSKAGFWGVIAFDFITGPMMSSFIFRQGFIETTIMQIPFTIMHLVSAWFSIIIITPFLDKDIMKEVKFMASTAKKQFVSFLVAFS